jgi:hypothetical protein
MYEENVDAYPHLIPRPTTKDRPALERWSDLAWLGITNPKVKAKGTDYTPASIHNQPKWNVKNLRYVLRASVGNHETLGILYYVAALKQGASSGTHWKIKPFRERVDLDANSHEGRAIIGTPNGLGTAWMLIQHKKELGVKKISKVSLFQDEGASSPSILFTIENANH